MTQEPLPPAYGPPPPAFAPPFTWTPPPALLDRLTDRIAGRAILSSIGAGMLAQLLFFLQAPGINWPIWIAVVIGAAWTLRPAGAHLDRYDVWLAPAALVFAGFVAVRDDAALLLFDFVASGALTLASVVAIGGHPVSRSAWSTVASLAGYAIALFWSGGALLSSGVRPLIGALPTSRSSRGGPLVRGLLLAVPLVLGFGLLFAAADAVFQVYLQRLVDVRIDGAQAVGRITFALLAGWLFAGTMATAYLSRNRFAARPAPAAETTRLRLGTSETLVVLVALDLVFAAFVAIQAAYLFPLADPLTETGMSYADYARRGFFELITVAALSGMVVMALDHFVEERTRGYRVATVALAAMTGFVLVSAVWRLSLYQQAYGWTELRFYALAAIGWLAIGVAATILALLVRRVSALPKVMLASGFAIALLCNLIGPQTFVTQQNLQRAIDPSQIPVGGYAGLDIDYLDWLGADTIPTMLASLDRLPADDQIAVRQLPGNAAASMREQAVQDGWPSWNLAREQALNALTTAGY